MTLSLLPWGRVLGLTFLLTLGSSFVVSSDSPGVEVTPSEFTRFLDGGRWQGQFQTSVVRYKNSAGVEVDLISAVHVGDTRYYKELERQFRKYDAMLYEMIKPKGVVPRPGGSGGWVGILQRAMKNALDLDFQLDAIDYRAGNFVHADLDPKTFSRLQREKGESIFSLLLKSAMRAFEQQATGRAKSSEVQMAELLAALTSADSARSLKYLLAQELVNLEQVISGFEGDGEESVILTERNKHAFRVFEQQVKAGKKRLGIFYGAAHMPDLEERLFAAGFEKIDETWVTAWQIGPAPEPKPKKAQNDTKRRERF